MQIGPQPGRQSQILASSADIALYGGAAGGGKTYALLLEAARHANNPGFGAVIFRRTTPPIRNEGGLWDESEKLYPRLGGVPREHRLEWVFPSGASVQFRHLEYDKTLEDWHGAQVPLICFDELTEFSSKMFWYMLSRNRSTCGVRPYLRATCNPLADSWVADLIDWWIGEDGLPIDSRAGVLRWFVRSDDELLWSGTREGAVRLAVRAGRDPADAKDLPKSLTFVPARLEDNPLLMRKDPGYKANLLALEHVDQQRLYHGNWKVRANAGLLFPRGRWQLAEAAPRGPLWLARGWDKAATPGGSGARSAGVLVCREVQTGGWWLLDCVCGRWGFAEREEVIRRTADMDAQRWGQVTQVVEQEPGSGGKDSAMFTARSLAGHDVRLVPVTGSKSSRWRPLAAQQQAGSVSLLADGSWDWESLVRELDALAGDEQLDRSLLKDRADAASLAFNWLTRAEDYQVRRELLCSGGRVAPLADDEVDELPPLLADIIRGVRAGRTS